MTDTGQVLVMGEPGLTVFRAHRFRWRLLSDATGGHIRTDQKEIRDQRAFVDQAVRNEDRR